MKTVLIVTVAALCAAIGESLLSVGMKKFGPLQATDPSHWWMMAMTIVKSPWVFLGVLFLAGFFFLFLAALSWSDLSFVLPLTALSYLFAAFLAKYFLQEDVSWLRWAGTIVIVLGIILVALDTSPARTTQDTVTQPAQERVSGQGEKS